MCYFRYSRVLGGGIRALSRAKDLLRSLTASVLSNRVVQKRWVPPYNVSAVPWNARAKIPAKFRYWTFVDKTKRREVRDDLVSAIKRKLKSKRWVDRRSTG